MSLFGAIAISASGMQAQRTRAEIIAENLANADTTRTPDGGPYRRKDAVFSSTPLGDSFSDLLSASDASFGNVSLGNASFGTVGAGASTGVSISQILTDERDPERRYLPGHPDADTDGYVSFPRINPAEEMADLLGASRGYQANVAAIAVAKDMIARSIDLFR